MKIIYTLFLAFIFSVPSIAQTASATVFAELGEKFTLYINGEAKNSSPAANVKVTGITTEFLQARIDFEDPTLKDFASNFAVEFGTEVTYIIKKNKKGEYVLRVHSQGGVIAADTPAPVVKSETEDVKRVTEVDKVDVVTTSPTSKTTVKTTGVPADEDVQITQTTTTTTTKPAKGATGEKVNVGINIGGINMGMNVEVQDSTTGMEIEENSSTTVTKTTTKTTTTTSKPAPTPAPAPKREEIVVVKETSGCGIAMSESSYKSALSNVTSKGFDDTKLSTAKTIIKANCMTAAQIKGICSEFAFEETKLNFAKYAYDYCTDRNNYFVVNEVFGFSSSTEELNKYIDSKN